MITAMRLLSKRGVGEEAAEGRLRDFEISLGQHTGSTPWTWQL